MERIMSFRMKFILGLILSILGVLITSVSGDQDHHNHNSHGHDHHSMMKPTESTDNETSTISSLIDSNRNETKGFSSEEKNSEIELEIDHSATIIGSLLMVLIVGVGLIIAYVLNVYRKRLDERMLVTN